MIQDYSKINSKELAFNGPCGYELQPKGISLFATEIVNSQPNITSGSLSLELWALDHSYTGGYFEGHPIASAKIGELFGEHLFRNVRYLCDFLEPPEGKWNLTLMLREWNGIAYETRDFINFSIPYCVPSIAENVTETKSLSVEEIPETTSTNIESGKISLNAAILDDLNLIKGLPKITKFNILAGQPYHKWDDVANIKGIGKTMLDKLKNFFHL